MCFRNESHSLWHYGHLASSIHRNRKYDSFKSLMHSIWSESWPHCTLYFCKVSGKYLKRFPSCRTDTILWRRDGRTDWRTDGKKRGKNNISPHPEEGKRILSSAESAHREVKVIILSMFLFAYVHGFQGKTVKLKRVFVVVFCIR